MGTNDKEKRQMTPAERRRRMEARKKRQKKLRRKRQMQRILLIAGLIAVAALIIIGIIAVVRKISGGSKKISAKGEHYVIFLDPGHGGEDTGLSSDAALEKDIDLEICSKLKIMLEGQGYEVILSREEDVRLSKEERVAAANASGADLLVSVHCNYAQDSGASGIVSYYEPDSKESKTLCENIQKEATEESGAPDGGTLEGSFSIINDTDMPAVLVEAGYLSNSMEAGDLAEDSYRNDMAKGIAKGIILSLSE